MYKAIFLDIDDTVLNFPKSSEGAFKDTFDHFNLDFTDDLYNVYLEINDHLWKKQKNEEIRITFRRKKEKNRELFLLLQISCVDRSIYPDFCNRLYQRYGDEDRL